MDAGDLFAALREPHETAAIPVLFIGNRITGSVRQHPCRMAIDGDMDETATPDAVAAWLAKRLREHAPDDRDSNIDPMTGLPNRPPSAGTSMMHAEPAMPLKSRRHWPC